MARDLRNVIDAVMDGVVVLDVDGAVELVNAEASRILGISSESAAGLPMERLLGSDHAVVKLARTVLATGRSTTECERPIPRRFDTELLVDVTAAPLFGEDRRVDGVALVLRDRTILHTLEEVVSQRETLSAFGRIAAGIAHEVKNPLGGIRGAAELIAARASEDKTRDTAGLIVREVDRITTLVDDLMVFDRDADLTFEPMNIHMVLDDVLELLASDPLGRGVAVDREFDPSIPEMLGDAARLTQVFLNLGRNGLQALEGVADPKLTFTTRMAFDQRLSTRDGRPLPTLVVTVEDNGPGIENDVLEKLATPFFTTRTGGMGLGLAVSRNWVARHDGTLRVESEPGHGSAVRVALPLRRIRS